MQVDDLSEYEVERLANIQRNQELAEMLGLGSMKLAARGVTKGDGGQEDDDGRATERKRRFANVSPIGMWKSAPPEIKRSKRIAGEPGPSFPVREVTPKLERVKEAIEDIVIAEDDEQIKTDPSTVYTHVIWKGLRLGSELTEYTIPADVSTPITLLSIGTMILDIGRIVTGEKRHLYWPRKGVMFKHPFPVGYRAVKDVFGHRFFMSILETEEGPLFEIEIENGEKWHGPSATSPWSDICKRFTRTKKTRVSGPLFYGFSDPITMKLIESLPGYEPWGSVELYIRELRQRERDDAAAAEADGNKGNDAMVVDSLELSSDPVSSSSSSADTSFVEPEDIFASSSAKNSGGIE